MPERILEHILPKKLTLVLRTWTTKDGEENQHYRMRVYIPSHRKYHYITLSSETYNDAKEESINRYLGMGKDIEEGIPVNNDRKKLPFFIDMFMKHMETRLKNGKVTKHRVVCVRQLLRCLEKFAEEMRNPAITELVDIYDEKFENWRDKSLTRLTNKPLSPRTRNNEYNSHRQFFGFLVDKKIISRVPDHIKVKVHQTNKPFPQNKYNALLKASRDAINGTNHPKIKWNWMCMRTVILLMAGTGCRVTEVKNLQWKHISMDSKKNPRIFLHGKGKEREISISHRVYGHLMDLKDFKHVWGDEWNWNEKDYPVVFASWKMEKILNQFDSWGRRQWYEKIGLDPKEYPLVCFRHKFISDALRNGTHALQIAFYTGTSVAMIQQTYGKITSPELFAQVFSNAPDEALEGKQRSKWLEEQLSKGVDRNERISLSN